MNEQDRGARSALLVVAQRLADACRERAMTSFPGATTLLCSDREPLLAAPLRGGARWPHVT